MEKTYLLIIAIVVIILLGIIYKRHKDSTSSTSTKTVNASKTVVVHDVDYVHPRYVGLHVPPPNYNAYKAQFYN